MMTDWAVVRNDVVKLNHFHVMPRADVRCHIASPMCFCKPVMQRVQSGWMWSHDAMDGRS